MTYAWFDVTHNAGIARIILLLTKITSFHVYVLERYDICMVRRDAQRWNSTNHAYVISL